MTFYHFINCLLLTFSPLLLLYKFSSLSEYGTVWRCLTGILAYIVTQLFKLLIIAVIMTPSNIWSNIIDCCGLYWFMVKQQKASVSHVKILSIALGWSLAESVFTRLIDFYLNARSMQFNTKHILSACDANVSLLQNISVCALLWQWSRNSNKLSLVILMAYLMSLSFIEVNLLWKTCFTLSFSIITLFVIN